MKWNTAVTPCPSSTSGSLSTVFSVASRKQRQCSRPQNIQSWGLLVYQKLFPERMRTRVANPPELAGGSVGSSPREQQTDESQFTAVIPCLVWVWKESEDLVRSLQFWPHIRSLRAPGVFTNLSCSGLFSQKLWFNGPGSGPSEWLRCPAMDRSRQSRLVPAQPLGSRVTSSKSLLPWTAVSSSFWRHPNWLPISFSPGALETQVPESHYRLTESDLNLWEGPRNLHFCGKIHMTFNHLD